MSFERGFLTKPAVKALLATWPAPAIDLPRRETHPCGRCGKPAEYVDRSMASGGVMFICYHCDSRGLPTLVFPKVHQPIPLAEAMDQATRTAR